jgi:hypothetical protein
LALTKHREQGHQASSDQTLRVVEKVSKVHYIDVLNTSGMLGSEFRYLGNIGSTKGTPWQAGDLSTPEHSGATTSSNSGHINSRKCPVRGSVSSSKNSRITTTPH